MKHKFEEIEIKLKIDSKNYTKKVAMKKEFETFEDFEKINFTMFEIFIKEFVCFHSFHETCGELRMKDLKK